MTYMRLINYCTRRDGNCKKCVYTKYCNQYKKLFNGDIPLDDDEFHPDRYIKKEIILEE